MTTAPTYPITEADLAVCHHEHTTRQPADPGVGIPHAHLECDECGAQLPTRDPR